MTAQPIRILLVEDNPADADLVREMLSELRDERFDVQHLDRLEPALVAAGADEFELVLLDLSLPDSHGLETFRRLRERLPAVPIIVLSGLKDQDLAIKAVRLGAQDYLLKDETTSALLGRALRYAMERHRAEEALRESEARYALAVHGANDGIWDWDIRKDAFYFSPRWKTMLGYTEEQIVNLAGEWFDRVHPADLERLKADLQAHLAGEGSHFANEHRILHRDGSYRWVLTRGVAIRDSEGQPCRMAGSQTDITDRKGYEGRLQHNAFHDTLTGLANRALFMDRLAHALQCKTRHPDLRCAVLFLDLDRFKLVNDSFGHPAGDALLVSLARRLESCVRLEDSVARVGGDEFAVLLEDVAKVEDATMVADRVLASLSQPFVISGQEVFASASIGIALSEGESDRPDEVVRDADTAMYRAKALGKSRYVIFDEGMHRNAMALLRMETDLRRALDREEFLLYYQPIVRVADGTISGLEALLRWQHPTKGLIHPAEFIEVAEDTGLIVPLGSWVLSEACRQLRLWQDQFPSHRDLTISVNLSGRQFAQRDLVAEVRNTLERSGLRGGNLGLEITESVIMQNAEHAVSMMFQLRELDVEVCLDDFGTGYSSLNYLVQFPTSVIKIDRSFVSDINSRRQNVEIVRAIVSLARNLGMKVVAEGVETTDQLSHLKRMHCDYAQGYLFSEPVDGAIGRLLASEGPVAW